MWAAVFFMSSQSLPRSWLSITFLGLNYNPTSDIKFVSMSKLFNLPGRVHFISISKKKMNGESIHGRMKVTAKLSHYYHGLIVNYYLPLQPTPRWNKDSPMGPWQFSLSECLTSALRSWWKTCRVGRGCLGVITSESRNIIRVSLLIKSSTHYFPLH